MLLALFLAAETTMVNKRQSRPRRASSKRPSKKRGGSASHQADERAVEGAFLALNIHHSRTLITAIATLAGCKQKSPELTGRVGSGAVQHYPAFPSDATCVAPPVAITCVSLSNYIKPLCFVVLSELER